MFHGDNPADVVLHLTSNMDVHLVSVLAKQMLTILKKPWTNNDKLLSSVEDTSVNYAECIDEGHGHEGKCQSRLEF